LTYFYDTGLDLKKSFILSQTDSHLSPKTEFVGHKIAINRKQNFKKYILSSQKLFGSLFLEWIVQAKHIAIFKILLKVSNLHRLFFSVLLFFIKEHIATKSSLVPSSNYKKTRE
jgi:hypothetical protein